MSTFKIKYFLISLLSSAAFFFLAGEEKLLTVIQTADLHGYVSKYRIFRTAQLVRQVTESVGRDRSIRIDCGDLIQGSHAMTFEPWRSAMFRILSDLDFEVFIPGNHDLEFGVDSLKRSLADFKGSVCAANWQWNALPSRKDFVILHKNGLKAAVIGLGYHAVYDVLRPKDKNKIRAYSVRRTMHRIMPRVMKEKPHIIILALHAGEYTFFEKNYSVRHLVREFPQIDLVLTAHSHQECSGVIMQNNTLRMQAPPLGKGIAAATITYDTRKHAVTSIRSRIIPVTGDTPVHRELYRKTHSLDRIVKRAGRKVVGTHSAELGPLSRGRHANDFSRLCSEAIASHTGAEIVFYTPSPRYRKNPGVLYEYELFLLLPYEEWIGTMELTSHECRQLLAEQLRNVRKNSFQSPSGIQYQARRGRVISMILPENDPSGKWKCAFSAYALSQRRFPVLQSLVKKQKITFHPLTVRDMVRNRIAGRTGIRK